MIIVIARTPRIADYWLREGRLSPHAPSIVLCERRDCDRLMGYELNKDTTIARVGLEPIDSDYIESFIKTRMR